MIEKVTVKEEKIYDRDLKLYENAAENLHEVLIKTVEKFPEREAIVLEEQRLTYRDFYSLVLKASANLQHSYNVSKGDRIAILSHNTIEFCVSIFAISLLGGIVVPLNTRLRPSEVQFMLKNSEVKILIVEDSLLDVAEEAIKIADMDLDIFIIGEKFKTENNNFSNYEVLFRDNKAVQPVEVQKTDPLFIMYTSGTTGTPKGALGTHLGITQNVLNFSLNLNTNEKDRSLVSVPLFHVTGLVASLTHMISVGGTSVLMHKFKTNKLIQQLDKENITYINTVPTIFMFLLNHPERERYDLSHLRMAVTGGSPMPVKTVKQFMELYPNINFVNNYGATECTGSCTFSRPKDAINKADSVGLFSSIIDWKVVDDLGEELPLNEIGELYIKGPTVIPEYWKNEEATIREFDNGYWKSGDIGYVDKGGSFFLLDRKKSMINRGGENIYTAEIENILYNHPSVDEVAVVGIPDKIFGEEVLASIVLKENEDTNEQGIKSFVGEYLADYKVPKFIAFVNELPRNTSGKVLKNRVKEAYLTNN